MPKSERQIAEELTDNLIGIYRAYEQAVNMRLLCRKVGKFNAAAFYKGMSDRHLDMYFDELERAAEFQSRNEGK